MGWGYAMNEQQHAAENVAVRIMAEKVIEEIEETFLAHLPSKALSYCAQEDINAGLDAMRELFELDDDSYCAAHGHNPTDGDSSRCIRCGRSIR